MNASISIDDIKLLHLIYHHGSITKACENAGMSQSNLSKKLQSIEERLGVRLFIRTTRKISITPAGQQFLTETAIIPQVIDSAIASLQKQSTTLRVDLSSSLSNAHVPGFIRKQDLLQGVSVRVAQHGQQEIVNRLRTGSSDVAILPYTTELDKVATIHQQIDDQFVLLVNSAVSAPSKKLLNTWAGQQRWLLPDSSDITHHQIMSWLRQDKVDCTPAMEIPNFDLINHLVALKHGVAIVPQRSLRLFYNKSLVTAIKLGKHYSRKIVVATPLTVHNPSMVDDFIDTIVFS